MREVFIVHALHEYDGPTLMGDIAFENLSDAEQWVVQQYQQRYGDTFTFDLLRIQELEDGKYYHFWVEEFYEEDSFHIKPLKLY